MEKPTARGPSPGRKAVHVLGGKTEPKTKAAATAAVKEKDFERRSHG